MLLTAVRQGSASPAPQRGFDDWYEGTVGAVPARCPSGGPASPSAYAGAELACSRARRRLARRPGGRRRSILRRRVVTAIVCGRNPTGSLSNHSRRRAKYALGQGQEACFHELSRRVDPAPLKFLGARGLTGGHLLEETKGDYSPWKSLLLRTTRRSSVWVSGVFVSTCRFSFVERAGSAPSRGLALSQPLSAS